MTEQLNWNKVILGSPITLCVLIGACSLGSVVEGVDAGEIVVIQYPSGGMNVAKDPGWTMQWFGKVSRYAKRGKIDFFRTEEVDSRVAIAFNDNGRAGMSASLQYTLPLNDDAILKMHAAYPDEASLIAGLLKPPVAKAIFVTGQLMNSYESYAAKRALLAEWIEDQAQNGAYQTQPVEREVEEETLDDKGQPIMRKKKTMENVIVRDAQGQPRRSEVGQVSDFKIELFGFAISELDYSAEVDAQIKAQQAITMAVQTSIANARKAQQDAVTAEAQGRANVATARAEQEIDKTKAIVQGEKARDIAALKAQEAEAYKRELLLRADADAEYKRRIMQADGALQQKLDAYKYGVDKIAGALATGKQPLVPAVMIGGSQTGGNVNALDAVMNLILAGQAKALGLNLNQPQQEE